MLKARQRVIFGKEIRYQDSSLVSGHSRTLNFFVSSFTVRIYVKTMNIEPTNELRRARVTSKDPKPRHYVIVVHGMGVQKENVTAYEVIHRFAEVRQGTTVPYRNLLPPSLSSQSVRSEGGHGWAEFRGIPIDPADDTGPFDGLPPIGTSGRNFRFVDLRWSQILTEDEQAYACPMKQWTEALREKFATIVPPEFRPSWAGPLLQQIEDSASTAQAVLRYFQPTLATLIFDEILGDIHLYGDYTRTRGKAVRHFHFVLDEIFLRDLIDWCRYEPGGYATYQVPTFTVIAHSLGSIMSYDALMYAFAQQDIRDDSRRPRHPCPSLPFPAYTEPAAAEEAIWQHLLTQLKNLAPNDWTRCQTRFNVPEAAPGVPLILWRHAVKEFITLGSPIDKLHALWYQNYLHMGFHGSKQIPATWASDWIEPPQHKITHFNLCDEQDPVGHHLDLAQSTVNYKEVFDTTTIPVAYRDITFRRYPVPGLAHVEYWRDRHLFEGIVYHVMGLLPGGLKQDVAYFALPGFRDLEGTYRKILVWAYFRIPLIAAMATGVLLIYGLGGLAYTGFSIGSVIAVTAAIFLWVRPYSAQAYRAEDDHHIHGSQIQKWWRIFWMRWKLRQGLFADLVAGAVKWRRILILQSQGEATTLEKATQLNVRLGFTTQGGFWKSVLWRYLFGTLWFLPTAYYCWVYYQQPSPPSPRPPSFMLMGMEGIAILSLCYLLTMAFVTRAFLRAKKLRNIVGVHP